MIKKIAQRLIILLVLVSAIAGYYYYTISQSNLEDTLYYGEVQLETYDVYATTTGIVEDVHNKIGDLVNEEDLVITLDSDLAQIQYDRSIVGQSVAIQELVKSDTGAGEESLNIQSLTIEQLQSQKESLEASISGSWQLYKQSTITSDSLYAAYELQASTYEDLQALYEANLETKSNLDQGALAVTNSKNAYDSALLTTSKIRSDITSLENQVVGIEAQIASAQEGLKQLEGGYEDVDRSIVELSQAQADLDVASYAYYLDQYKIKAYNRGVIDAIYYEKGELVNAGSAVLSLHNPEVMEVIIYVSEKDLLQLTLGQLMDFNLVADPQVVLQGSVTDIAREAMFTPVNIVTAADRERLVFEVKVDLEVNEQVKSGMLLVTDISELD